MAVRFLNTDSKQDELFSYLPDILESQNLYLSQSTCLFKLGYTDLIINDFKSININDEIELENHFKKVANQPFRNQMLYETNFLANNEIQLKSKILGCTFIFFFEKDVELLLAAETFAAFFESFLATSLTNVFPNTESISLKLVKNTNENLFLFSNKESSSEYQIEINKFNFTRESKESLWMKMLEFASQILATNFFIDKPLTHLENLFKKEELHERLTFIFEHRNFTINVLGNKPKLFFEDWTKSNSIKRYLSKRNNPISFTIKEDESINKEKGEFDLNKIGHNQRSVSSIIDTNLWENAEWQGFGFFIDSYGLGVFIGYKNGSFGKKIFDNWIKRFGKEDKDEKIKLTIIKGVDKNNPYWYRVHIGLDIKKDILKSGDIILSTARFHEMNANSPDNLNNLINAYNRFKLFIFCPAEMTLSANKN